MRNYLMIEKSDGKLYLSNGTGMEVPEEEKKDAEKYWDDWEEIETEEMLFKRVKELFYEFSKENIIDI